MSKEKSYQFFQTTREVHDLERIVLRQCCRLVTQPPEDTDLAINEALQDISLALGADAAYFSEICPIEAKQVHRYAWSSGPFPFFLAAFYPGESDRLKWRNDQLRQGNLVVVPAVDECSQMEVHEREVLEANGVCSFLEIPFQCQGNTVGYMGFSSRKKGLVVTDQEVSLLKLFGRVMTHGLMHRNHIEHPCHQWAMSETGPGCPQSEEGHARIQKEQFVEMMDLVPLPVSLVRGDTQTFVYANQAYVRESGYSLEELVGKSPVGLRLWENPEDREVILSRIANEGVARDFETSFRTKSGEVRSAVLAARAIVLDEKRHLMTIGYDSTEKERRQRETLELERQQKDKQKSESLVMFAGGVAHDFNNLLMAILGNIELAKFVVPEASPVAKYLGKIAEAALKAAELSRKMLAFSGCGSFFFRPVDINEIIRELVPEITAFVSANIELKIDLKDSLPRIDADVGHFKQLVLNLVMNAVEAIGKKRPGVISLKTSQIHCDEAFLARCINGSGLAEGEYLCFDVSDNGAGMDEATVDKLFSPFFSTKFPGRGLGLAVALGIIRGHRGAVRVYSAPQKGSLFRVVVRPSTVEDATAAAR